MARSLNYSGNGNFGYKNKWLYAMMEEINLIGLVVDC
jgi:hypothetical protein